MPPEWGLSIGNVSRKAHLFFVFWTIQEETSAVTSLVERQGLRGYTMVIITTHASGQHIGAIAAFPDPFPNAKCFKTVKI